MAKIADVQEVSLRLLKPYEKNAKIHGRNQIEKLKDSISAFGFLNPCLIDGDLNIIAGHGRVMAAKELGWETVPCVFIEGLTEAERRAYILADNRLAELASWDMDIVNEELTDLDDMDFNIELTGFELEADVPEVHEDDYEEDSKPEPRAKRGDIYQLGSHRLMCGDSTSVDDAQMLMGGVLADMVFTDPPWNVNYGDVEKGNAQGYKPRKILNDFMGTEDFKEFMLSAFFCMNQASKSGAMTYVVMSPQEWGNMMLTLAQNGYHWSSTIIWNKDSLVLSRKDYHTKYEPIWYGWKEGEARLCPLADRQQSDVWDFNRPKKSEEHPTMKPVPLVARAIENSSHRGDTVLDLFGGSGTTLIACEETERKCFMMELDPHYCDVIIDRWEQLTGGKAALVNV